MGVLSKPSHGLFALLLAWQLSVRYHLSKCWAEIGATDHGISSFPAGFPAASYPVAKIASPATWQLPERLKGGFSAQQDISLLFSIPGTVRTLYASKSRKFPKVALKRGETNITKPKNIKTGCKYFLTIVQTSYAPK
jgi:hypothetical protein